jgi:hypothetical protein
MSVFIRTVPNVMQHYQCSAETAQRYIDLRDEGYSVEQAALMAGLTDPPEPIPQKPPFAPPYPISALRSDP